MKKVGARLDICEHRPPLALLDGNVGETPSRARPQSRKDIGDRLVTRFEHVNDELPRLFETIEEVSCRSQKEVDP